MVGIEIGQTVVAGIEAATGSVAHMQNLKQVGLHSLTQAEPTLAMQTWGWIVVAIIAFMLFGSGKISGLMGDMAKGIKAFKKGMQEEDTAATPPSSGTTASGPVIDVKPVETTVQTEKPKV